MAIKNRVERLERQERFKEWLRFQRYLDCVTDNQLEFLVVFGYWPDLSPAEPLPGTSRWDSLPQKELLRLFEVDERKRAQFAHRSDEDKRFFIDHAHWPEKPCQSCNCAESTTLALRRKHQSRTAEKEGTNVI